MPEARLAKVRAEYADDPVVTVSRLGEDRCFYALCQCGAAFNATHPRFVALARRACAEHLRLCHITANVIEGDQH